jgi:predicted sulfurtransferase
MGSYASMFTARAVRPGSRRVASSSASLSAARRACGAPLTTVGGAAAAQVRAAARPARGASAGAVDADADGHADATPAAYQLITFFRFARVDDPEAEVERHRARIAERGWDLRGRIYVNEQGINAQMSGKGRDGEEYAKWVESDARFAGMRISVYPMEEQAHPRLALRYKPNLVQLEGGTNHLPLTNPEARAKPLTPEEWHENLKKVSAGGEDAPLLLDVRNGYEWDVGHFRGAERPVQESFRETVYTNVQEGLGPLAKVDKDKPIMMYCTGGIRCDVYSTVLREQGYKNVFTLEGGVQAYFDKFGKRDDQLWDDHLFVFDSRLAMSPDGRPSAELGEAAATLRCYCCGQNTAPPPHRNCPNVDCNRLFLVCEGCKNKLDGFCCEACTKATHIRPALVVPGRYQKYRAYDSEESRASRRGPGRRLRKERRRERRKLELAAYVLEHMTSADEDRARLVQSSGGTFADRTRSLVQAKQTIETDSDVDTESDNDDDSDDGSEEGRAINPALSRYSKQRATLREAFAVLAENERTPENLVKAAEDIALERSRMKKAPFEQEAPMM